MVSIKRKVSMINGSAYVNVPKFFRESLGLDKDSFVEVSLDVNKKTITIGVAKSE